MALCSAAPAQTGKNYDVKTMNFDLWCQEPAICLPRALRQAHAGRRKGPLRPIAPRSSVYEVPYLQQQQHDLTINRDIMHNDPVDNPVHQNRRPRPRIPTGSPNRRRPRNGFRIFGKNSQKPTRRQLFGVGGTRTAHEIEHFL